MNGQWIVQDTGTTPGLIMVNLDDEGDHYEGIASFAHTESKLPVIVAHIITTDKNRTFQINIPIILSYNPRTRLIDSWDNVKEFYGDVNFPSEADVQGEWDEQGLILNWKTNVGTEGNFVLPKSKADLPSECVAIPTINDWNGFKKYVSEAEGSRFLFRGQGYTWRLRTTFHRTGRANLRKFMVQDIPTLYKHISGKTRHLYNFLIPDHYGAFYNLVQHHGYPTPLLDWTYSPYIAAFFAYYKIYTSKANNATDDEKVRIFVFDQKQWRKDFEQLQLLDVPFPHFSLMEFIAMDNERMIPQQSVSSVTNVDDIESYIKLKETDEKKYLYVIDLPVKERRKVMSELSYMGITSGSLFSGLDGICEELKERFFSFPS